MIAPRLRLRHSGITRNELLVLLAMASCAYLGAMVGDHHPFLGRWSSFLCSIMGCFSPLLVLIPLAYLTDFAVGGIPRIPRCRDGCCHNWSDYKYAKFGDINVHLCPRGIRYRREGRRFVIVNDDHSQTPWLIWKSFRGWYPDE